MTGARSRPRDRAYADTNLFVVLFAGAEHPLYPVAEGLFRRVADDALRLIVTPIVVAELVYVAERVFRWSRSLTSRRLSDLLGAHGLELREGPVVQRALALYGRTARLDFADAYLGASALELGPPRVASLDSDLDRITGVTRVAR